MEQPSQQPPQPRQRARELLRVGAHDLAASQGLHGLPKHAEARLRDDPAGAVLAVRDDRVLPAPAAVTVDHVPMDHYTSRRRRTISSARAGLASRQ